MTQPLWRPVAGKYGRTRDGRKVGPMMPCPPGVGAAWQGLDSMSTNFIYKADGSAWESLGQSVTSWDLISEWTNDPAPAQPIDFSKIRVGDEIEVRLKVESLNRYGHPLVRQSPTVYQVYKPEQILRHIAARRPDEIGCRVRVVAQGDEAYTAIVGETGTVKFIENGFVTFMRDAGAYGLARIDDLVRIDGETA